MLNPVPHVKYHLATTAHRAKQISVDVKESVVENTNEPVRLAAVASTVYLVARVNGFKAGYKFAKNPPQIAI